MEPMLFHTQLIVKILNWHTGNSDYKFIECIKYTKSKFPRNEDKNRCRYASFPPITAIVNEGLKKTG